MEIVHALMRGRYRWAILLAIVLATPGAWGGYKLGRQIYRSSVPVKVESTVHRVLYNDEEKGALPRFESFVETQVALITSQRVIDMAIQNEKWAKLRRSDSADDELKFINSVNVDRKNELIDVSFDDPDQNVAMVGAEAVVKAYKKLYDDDVKSNLSELLGILQTNENAATSELDSKTQLLASLTSNYGGLHDIKRLSEGKYEELHKYEMTIADLQQQIQLVMPAIASFKGSGTSGDRQDWTPEDLAASDAILTSLLQQQAKLQQDLSGYRARGFGSSNPNVLYAESELDDLNSRLQDRIARLRAMPERLPPAGNRGANPSYVSNLNLLNQQLQSVGAQREKAEKQYRDLDDIAAQADNLRSDMEQIKKRLEDMRSRTQELNIESSMSDRISFPTKGDAERPLAPYKDTRRKFAVAGGLGGGLVGFGLVLLVTLLDRRVRNANEVSVRLSLGRLLGVLPALPEDLSQPEKAALAAHSVHQIRSMLQIRATHQKPCFAITSPLSGTGKTSLSLALAFSFASTGVKTLLIDCDLVGGGLTRRLNAIARKRIGRILRKKGLITTAQLRDALALAKERGQQLGETMIEMGVVSRFDVEQCLAAQETMSLGVMDVLGGESLMNCIAATGVDNCFVLPIGNATVHHAVSLSPSSVKRVISAARRHFDVIVIDSGPIPGSLEASSVAVGVDGVVMLVSRGEPRAVVEECLAKLRGVGAPVAGVVLNRVNNAEIMAYSGSISRTSRDGGASGTPPLRVEESELSKNIGPIARAVVSSSPMALSH